MSLCAFCGAESDSSGTRLAYGWVACAAHKIYLKPAKFNSKCHACSGSIFAGEDVVLCKHAGAWIVLHPYIECNLSFEQRESNGGPYGVLYLKKDAPWPVIVAAYKALATIHHPDRGGRLETMQKVNNAMDEIRGERGMK